MGSANLARHQFLPFAVAWASHDFLAYKELLKQKQKIDKAVVGIHFYQTHPNFIEHFLDDERIKFAKDNSGVTSEFRWKDRLEPFEHQVQNLITFCRRLPVTLLADDVGLGKKISAGLVASELIARNRVSKILIVAPKPLGPQWKDELGTKLDIAGEVVTGSKLVSAEPDAVGAGITTYHSARVHLDKIPDNRFDMLVLDEARKLRNLYGVDPTPQVARSFIELCSNGAFAMS